MSPSLQPQGERSVGELFGELARETSTLVRQEMKLATTELTQKATYAGKHAVTIALGALLGAVSLLALVGALILGLGMFIPLWSSALIVGALVGVTAYGVFQKGMTALKQLDPAPTQTLLSLKENKLWAQEQVR